MSLAEEFGLPASLGHAPVPGQRGAPGRDPCVGAAAEPARRGSGSVLAGHGRELCWGLELQGFGLPDQLGAGCPQAPVADVQWELPEQQVLFPSQDRSLFLLNLGSHHRVLPGTGIDPPEAPLLPELPDLPLLWQLQNETQRCLSHGSG